MWLNSEVACFTRMQKTNKAWEKSQVTFLPYLLKARNADEIVPAYSFLPLRAHPPMCSEKAGTKVSQKFYRCRIQRNKSLAKFFKTKNFSKAILVLDIVGTLSFHIGIKLLEQDFLLGFQWTCHGNARVCLKFCMLSTAEWPSPFWKKHLHSPCCSKLMVCTNYFYGFHW